MADDQMGWRFEYGDNGLVTRVADPSGRNTQFQYSFDKNDLLRNLVRKTEGGTEVTHTYDDRGRLAGMTDGAGEVSYGYDDFDRLNLVQRKGQPAVAYTYDTQGRVTQLAVGDFYRIDYGYDFLGRLESMNTPAGEIRYEYWTGQGQVVRTLPNGVKTFWKYQVNGELEQITHGVSEKPDDNRYTLLAEYTYDHGPDGRICAIRERSQQGDFLRQYTYDTMGRLTKATGHGGREYRYEYDQVGNRIRAAATGRSDQVCTYDWAGRLTTVDGKPATYDASGNLTEVTLNGVTRNYGYTPDRQLAEAQVGGEIVQYRYDGFGRMVARKTVAGETHFVPDPLSSYWQPLTMEESGGARTLVVWGGDTPLALVCGGKVEWLLHDHLGSVRVVVDGKGEARQFREYEPYGLFQSEGEPTALSPGFVGLFQDTIAGFSVTLARMYLPAMGGFLQQDPQKPIPMTVGETTFRYAYSMNDPLSLVDRNGMFPEPSSYVWEFTKAFVTELPETVIESWGAGVEFWRNAFSGGVEFGAQPGSLADQARRFGGVGYERAVQIFSGVSIAAFTVAGTSMVMSTLGNAVAALESRVVSIGLRYGGQYRNLKEIEVALSNPYTRAHTIRTLTTKEWFHLPLTPNAVSGAEHLHWGIGRFGAHLATKYGTHFYSLAKGVWHASFGANRISYAQYGARLLAPMLRNLIRFGPPIFVVLHQNNAEASAISPGILASSMGGGIKPTSPVGGIYLGGAGATIEGLGALKGVRTDVNGNIVLVGEDGGAIKLPPLRLDDVVTVFRSVYLHGEGPTVTIDPHPQDPHGSVMVIQHGKATANTYVGWVLFQADRLMKSYSLGKDNETEQDVSSNVPGYSDVLDTVFFGGGKTQRKDGNWERFWIVPAQTRQFSGAKNSFTLIDVPLKINTQSMKWQQGKLVDDTGAKSSPGALAFSQWFTLNYDPIAQEQMLMPPPESGMTEPVPVFAELRRVALITAIAEKLRDQGVPLPFWMRDHEVRQLPMEEFTAALEVPKQGQGFIARIYGGVNLSPADEDVRHFGQNSDLSKLEKNEHVTVKEEINLATSLENVPLSEMDSGYPLKVKQFTHRGINYQAASLPGTDTRALAPARLEEVDLSIAVEGDRAIQLVRSFNSFFNPDGYWGKGWALDLPQLEEIKVPVGRKSGEVHFQIGYELITPLNGIYARFANVEQVPALNNSRLQVSDKPSDFFGLADDQPDFLFCPTRKLIRKDGGAWHFSRTGDLIAIDQQGFRTVYERDEHRRVTRVAGLQGRRLKAAIELLYNEAGRLESATAKQNGSTAESVVRYEYDGNNRLVGVVSDTGRVGYDYQDSLVTSVTYRSINEGDTDRDITLRQFEYNQRGQLTSEVDSDGNRIAYRLSSDAEGSAITVVPEGEEKAADSIFYDSASRPVRASYSDGTRASWSYPESGGAILKLTDADGNAACITESADGSKRMTDFDEQRSFAEEFDSEGRLKSLSANGRVLLRQEWSPDGRLQKASSELTSAHLEYDADGLASRVLLAPPDESGQFKHWQAIKLDPSRRPTHITDYSGLEVEVDYAESGAVDGVASIRDEKRYGFKLSRDKSDRVSELQSSWGTGLFTYDDAGLLAKVETRKGDSAGSVTWQGGRLQKVQQFDGGEIQYSYFDQGGARGLLEKIVTPNQLVLQYQYDAESRLSGVTVGDAYRLALDYDAAGRLSGWSMLPPKG